MNGHKLRLIGLSLAVVWLVGIVCQFAAERFWFAEVGYTEVFWLRLLTQGGIWAIVSSLSAGFLLINLALAQRFKHAQVLESASNSSATMTAGTRSTHRRAQMDRSRIRRSTTPERQPVPLQYLLPGVLVLILLVGLLLLHQLQAVATAWQSATHQINGLPTLPDRFHFDANWQSGKTFLSIAFFPTVYLVIGLIGTVAIAVLVYPTQLLSAIALFISTSLGFILSAHWGRVLQFFHAVPFGKTDPLFANDISFYVFSLPIAELLTFWFVDLFLYGLLAVAVVYLLAGKSLSQGFFNGFSGRQRQHMAALGICLMLAMGLHYWLRRYELLYSTRGATYGAGYTDTTVLLPAFTVLSLLAGAIAIVLGGHAVGAGGRRQKAEGRRQKAEGRGQGRFRRSLPSFLAGDSTLILLGAYCAIVLVSTVLLPNAVQRLIVQPNELALEQPYIRRSIALTQSAFALDKIEVKTFNPQANLTIEALAANQQTTRNIRLWDTRPLLETNRQLQQIRPYYRFFDADIDRYTFESEGRGERSEGREVKNEGKKTVAKSALEKQQVLIAARELDYAAVPQDAQTWVNEHLVYTHGYGFTLSPVNEVADGGLPNYYVKDIGASTASIDRQPSMTNASLRDSIPTANPRLYYGELTNTYVMTGTQVQELDYPSGSTNVYNTYDGAGGVKVGAFWRRCLLAAYLRDWQMLLTTDFTLQTKLLFRRNINDRIRAIAPFLQYDRDPYLVVVDVEKERGEGRGEQGDHREQGQESGVRLRRERSAERRQEAETSNQDQLKTQNSKLKTQNYLYWIVDAYTTSDRYPYSDPSQLTSISGVQATPHGRKFNYIRNSVKVVIDAYNGSVDFYVADPGDPLMQTWSAAFPTLFKPLSQMPPALRSHIRYPADLFSVQSERLQTYHMTDPQVFYNREDLWQVPTEIYGDQPQLVEPYYLITKLTTAKNEAGDPAQDEEFILLLPYTPNRRTNLTAWLAARSDGENYGKSLLYVFPKQQLVYGTEQIEARINQDPVISQQIALWNRAGSRAIQGNLLVIPIEQSLLYVEPLYLQAAQNSLPTLVRVIVAYENRIAMAETLEQALRAVFQPKKRPPAIVRPVQ